jgi:hypothetical protein
VSTPLQGPGAPGYRIPSLGWRITVGALRIIPLLLVLVGLPAAALAFLASHGIALPISILTVTVVGAAITALSTARYIAKPTSLYGPLSVATSALVLGYLLFFVQLGSYTFTAPNGGFSIGINYTEFVELLLLVPGLALVAGVVTTLEDARSPRERLPYDFPP